MAALVGHLGILFERRTVFMMLLWLGVSLLYLGTGASGVSWLDTVQVVFGRIDGEQADLVASVLLDVRLPRYLKCVLTGASMAVAGVLTQGLFRNSLAAPSVLGVSAGASVMSCLAYSTGLYLCGFWVLPLASVLGSFAVIALVLVFMRTFGLLDRESILLTGFALNIFCGALVTLIVSLSLRTPGETPSIMHWLMGDFSYPLTTYAWFCSVVIAVCIVFALRLCPSLEAYMLGEEVVQTLAVNPVKLKYMALLLVATLVGFSVSMVGAVPFVGLIVPHIVRELLGPQIRSLVVYSSFSGGIFVLLADVLARTVQSPVELQTGVLLAGVGAPFFIVILIRQRKKVVGF